MRQPMRRRPRKAAPMSSDARAMVTMPEPMSILTDFCDWASRQPDSPVKALATQRPTMVVKTGLIDEERTMSGLLPWRGWQGPASRLQKQTQEDGDENHCDGGDDEFELPGRAVPARRSFIFVKTVTVLFILRTEELPMMAMLIE